ncbi:MAG: ABC transporter ATP-binding protein [Bacteroidota bacterium]|nr:ABC transporter ATP-binding protein [Bacteroidota bacterium]
MIARQTRIRLNDLSKSFDDVKAVDHLSLDIYKGEIFGFLGPNGAGKTTTIQMICGLLKPDKGSIEYTSASGSHISPEFEDIGICPQENVIWPKLTCYEQMKFVARMHDMGTQKATERSRFLLQHLGLTQKSHSLASSLSGGMKRRLNICLALVHDPQILILDEPEAGLDPQSRIIVRTFIKSLAGEKTILLTSHNMDEADRLSDRVAIIDQGKLLLVDSPLNLKKSIGEGDILEITIGQDADIEVLKKELSKLCKQVDVSGIHILLKSPNMVTIMPAIINAFKQHNIKIKEINLRENTLEDVFIHLTGRKLRQ